MDSTPKALVASAVILGLAIIVAADFLKSPYQIAGLGSGGMVYRLNQNTGEVTLCQITPDEATAADEQEIGILAHCDVKDRKADGSTRSQ